MPLEPRPVTAWESVASISRAVLDSTTDARFRRGDMGTANYLAAKCLVRLFAGLVARMDH